MSVREQNDRNKKDAPDSPRAAEELTQPADLPASAEMLAAEAAARLQEGELSYSQGRYAAALAQYGEAYHKYKEAGQPNGMGRAQMGQAQVYKAWGEYPQVLVLLQKAVDLFCRGGDVVALADSHARMADLYTLLGQEEWALELYSQAEAALATEGAALGVARCAQGRGCILGRQGRFSEALEQVDRAALLFHEEGLPLQEADAWIDKGAVLLLAGRADKARECYEQARLLLAAHAVLLDVARCDLGLGDVFLFRGEWQAAEKAFDRAAEVLFPAFPELAWRAFAGQAISAEQAGRTADALARSLQAVESMRRSRSWLPTGAWNGRDRTLCAEAYRRALRLAAQCDDGAAALQVMEAARSQSLTALLPGRGEGPAPTTMADDEALSLLRREVEATRQEVKGQAESGISDVQERLRLSATQMEQYEANCREHWAHGRAGFLGEWVPPFDLEELRREVVQAWPAGWLALAYDLDEALTVVAVDQDSCRLWRRVLSAEERVLLDRYSTTDEVVRRSLYSSADPSTPSGRDLRLLYDLLIPAPVAARLNPERLLLLVPSGCLDGLLFATLLGAGGPLVEQAHLALLPCLHSLPVLLQSAGGDPYRGSCQRLLLLGISHFAGRWTERPLAAEELCRIEAVWRGHADVRCLADLTATDFLRVIRGNFVSRCDLLHLSTHTRVGGASAWGVQVALRDNDVLFEDMVERGLDARLIVLAACRNSAVRPYGGEEKTGLPWVFFTMGVSTILANLWEEEEASGIELMERFHTALRDGKRPGRALGEAQRAMAAAGLAPYQWGGLALMGIP